MVDPITAAIVGGQVVSGIGGAFESTRRGKIAEAEAVMRQQAIDDLIAFQRLKTSREKRQILGTAVATAGTRGVQFQGSEVGSALDALQQSEFQALEKISELRSRKRLLQFTGDLAQDTAGLEAGGKIVGGFTKGLTTLKTQSGKKKTADALGKIGTAGTKTTKAEVSP